MSDDLETLLEAERRFPEPPPADVTAAFSRLSASLSVAAPTAAAGVTLKMLMVVGAAFVAGGVTGASLFAAFSPTASPPQPAQEVPAAPKLEEPAVAPPKREEPPVPPDLDRTPAVAPGLPVAPSPKRDAPARGTLARERQILDAARAALRAGHPAEALDAIDRHQRRFAGGKLGEERDALRVSVLVALGLGEEAERRARDFESRYPGSMFEGAIRKALSR